MQSQSIQKKDLETQASLLGLSVSPEIVSNRLPGIRLILVILSAKGMVYDREALRQKINFAYPEAALFFRNTTGQPIGLVSPSKVDLVIDFTGPGQRQPFFYARTLRQMATFIVGRKAGFFRKKIYDRVFDEFSQVHSIPKERRGHESFVQEKVLHLAGVALFQASEVGPDLSDSIALSLPGMTRLKQL